MAHLRLSFLGSFQVSLEGQVVPGFRTAKEQALLAYLATEAQQPRHRDTLASLLWPERPDCVARNNLRTVLSHLRDAIDDRSATPSFLLITRDTIQFNVASDYWLDIRAFEQLIADTAANPPRPDLRDPLSAMPGAVEHAVRNLRAAIALYHGCFLESFSVDSVAFEEWALLKREQLQRQMVTALRRLAASHEQRGEYESARFYAQQQLELEPWDENAHRQLMHLLALDGQRNAAIAQYQAYSRRLAEELRVEPADETTALYERIRDGLVGGVEEAPVGRGAEGRSRGGMMLPPTPQPSRPALACVARERELAGLDRCLRLALAGQGRVAFVTGDPGSGKTVLMAEFARRATAAHTDLIVARGKCSSHAGIGDPYLPFREILQVLTGDLEAERACGAISPEQARRLWDQLLTSIRTMVEISPGLIGSLVPAEALALRAEAFAPKGAAWRDRLVALAASSKAAAALGGPWQTDLFEQITRLLQALARQRPLVLILDDLQWADCGTLSLLFHLGRRLAGHRILLVAAYRPGDLALVTDKEQHPLEPVVSELQRDFGDIRVDLDQSDGRQFVEAFLDLEPNRLGKPFREILYRYTDGNPLFTVELLRGLRERGHLVQDESGCWLEGPSLDWERLPARVEAVIAERIGRVTPECRRMLTVASVEGEEFTAEVIAQIQGLDEREVVRHLSGPLCRQHHLVTALGVRRVDGRRVSRYRFQHALFQAYLYRSLDEVERPRLHEAVGLALETLYGKQTAEISGELARHFEAAGMIPEAVGYLLQAGRQTVQLAAYEEASAIFARGLALLAAVPETPERDRQEFALRLAM